MEIIKAELIDKDDIKKIADLLYIEVADFVWNKDDFIEKQINNKEYFVAKEENKVVGIMSFRQRQNIMYIETIAVIKEFQGKGIGAQFIDFAKNYTRASGFEVLRAYAFFQYNTQKFYLKNGFTLLNKLGKYNGAKYYRFEMKIK